MQIANQIEYEKRIRTVQEWLIEDWPYMDIISQINSKWGIEDRQAKRYVAEARDRWKKDSEEALDQKRRLKVASLKKLKRSLTDKYKGTPMGIRAVVAVEKEIITLEGLRPASKVEITGRDGRPIATENNTVVLYIPSNNRDAKTGN